MTGVQTCALPIYAAVAWHPGMTLSQAIVAAEYHTEIVQELVNGAVAELRERGVGMIYVSHRLDEIFRIADRVAVLRDGQLVGVKPVATTIIGGVETISDAARKTWLDEMRRFGRNAT